MYLSHGNSGVRTLFVASLLAASMVGCGGGGASDPAMPSASMLSGSKVVTVVPGDSGGSANAASVDSASPSDGSVNVLTSTNSSNNVVTGSMVSANFSQAMDPATIISALAGAQQTFTLKDASGNNIPGTVAMNATNTVATFTPSASALIPNTSYTAMMTTAARTTGGIAMAMPVAWSFKTNQVLSTGQAPVNLGTAGTFTILSKTGITDVYKSAIVGNVGTSPITGAALLLTCGEVVGKIYVVDAAGPLPCAVNDATALTAAVGDMGTAYLDAQGRKSPNFTELGAGEI